MFASNIVGLKIINRLVTFRRVCKMTDRLQVFWKWFTRNYGFGNRISGSIIVDFASHDLINFWFTTWRMFSITINMLLYLLWEKIKFWIFLYPKSWVPDVRRYYYNKLSWKLRRSYLQNREVNVWQISVPYLQLFNQNSRLVMKIYKKALFLRS